MFKYIFILINEVSIFFDIRKVSGCLNSERRMEGLYSDVSLSRGQSSLSLQPAEPCSEIASSRTKTLHCIVLNTFVLIFNFIFLDFLFKTLQL